MSHEDETARLIRVRAYQTFNKTKHRDKFLIGKLDAREVYADAYQLSKIHTNKDIIHTLNNLIDYSDGDKINKSHLIEICMDLEKEINALKKK